MARRTKPNDFKDSDKDGLSDQAEAYFGTDPNNPDSDGDGMSDRDEVVRGRNPLGKGKLRDMFIPHAGNNYHPHSLHPKRVAFHAASALAVKAAVVGIMLGLPATAWLTPDILREQQQKIITLTNSVRENLGIPALAEHATLNQAADYKAQDMLDLQYFAHENSQGKRLSGFLGDAGYLFEVAGENLAMGFADAESVVNAWVKSPTHYANLVDASYRDIGVGLVSGDYDGFDTTLVAQYFGTPFSASGVDPSADSGVDAPGGLVALPEESGLDAFPKASTPPRRVEAAKLSSGVDPSGILGTGSEAGLVALLEEPQETEEEPAPLAIDESQSMVYVLEDQEQGTIVRAIVRITGATSADVQFSGNSITLAPHPNTPDLWIGSTTVFQTDKEKLFDPVVLPSATARSADGQTITQDLSWERVSPVRPALLDQYFFMRQQDSGIIGSLRTVSSLYFTLLLALAIIALALMIFVEIKKQHPKHIASGLGLIALLALAIML